MNQIVSKSVVMFLDMVGSTRLKYEAPDDYANLVKRFYGRIEEITEGRRAIKFTGDGAMVVYRASPGNNVCKMALTAAERIIRANDIDNLQFSPSWRVFARCGVAYGGCEDMGGSMVDIIGRPVDLAARLCAEALRDGVLTDRETKEGSLLPSHRFRRCERRLSLEGVPIVSGEQFYDMKIQRLLKSPQKDPFSRGLLALYSDRPSLIHDFGPLTRWLQMVAPNSTVLVAGRTLVAWTSFATEMSAVAREKNVCFKFLIASDQMQPYLDAKQVAQFKTDLPYARETFLDLVRKNPAQFHLRETDQLILDGITCVRVLLPGGETEPATRASKLLVLHDINAAAGDSKAAFLLACTCNRDGIEGDESCMAHGLLARTTLLYDRAARADAEVSAATQLLVHKEGISSRNNIPANYLYHVIPHLRCVESDAMKSVPPPLCVQVQISAKCSTHCRMCEHWKETASHQLDTQQWHTIFGDLAAFEVRTVVFSGGEPLTQEALPELLKSAVGAGLKVGLLTNGTLTEKSSDERRHVIDAIREFVSWVAVSIDGRPAEDEKIRNPLHTLEGRTALLKEFCTALKDKVPTSATVTLQSDNIQMDLREACRSIKEDLGVQNINFKLATGSTLALQKPVSFLLNQTELDGLVDFLWQNPLAQEGENNLDYLRRCFASGIFNIADAANGAPLQSFYKKDHRCYTPFLFSLIDSDGAVYPCCHLYRDNHSMDRKTREYRDKHRIGFAHETPFRYIWNSDAYALKRRELQKIDPDEPTFEPCGECTRHCQHNRALSQIQNEYAGRLDVLERLLANKPGSEDVWF